MKKPNYVSGYTRWTLRRHGLQRAEEEINEMMNPILVNAVAPFQEAESTHEGESVVAGDDLPQEELMHDVDETLDSYHDDSQNKTNGMDHENVDPSMDSDIEAEFSLTDCEDEDSIEVHASIYLPKLCLLYYLRDHLTKTALSHHLRILCIAANIDIKEITSTHNLLSRFQNLKTEVTKIYVCPRKKCDAELILTKKRVPHEKQPCGHKFVSNRSGDCYILQIPIAKQIIHYVETYGHEEKSAKGNPILRGDVSSGENYRKLQEQGIIDERTITLQLNTDGAQPFKSSKFGIWPLMGIVNEASYRTRRSSIILIALWFGNKKPPRNTLFQRAIEDLNHLSTTGVRVKDKIYKVRVLVITTDTVARPLVRNSTQFNGEFGCDFCLHPGERVAKKKGFVRVYPQPQFNPTFEPRTMNQFQRDLEIVLKTKKRVNGIIGPNPFQKLNEFDHVESFVPEYMHSCCLGVFKQFLNLWIDSSYKNMPWYIGNKLTIINARFQNVKPPYDISRTIDSLDNVGDWKASMFRSFALYYFHLLEDILAPLYFKQFSSLVYGIFLLLQECVSVDDVLKVQVVFNKFVVDTEILYGKCYVGINVHFLVHLPECVLKWGCLWATSAYIPEWFNGALISMSKGSQCVVEQMVNNYLINLTVRDEAMSLLKEGNLPPHIETLFQELLFVSQNTRKQFGKGKLANSGMVKLIGSPCNQQLTIDEEVALRNTILSNSKYEFLEKSFHQIEFYLRFQILSTSSIFTTTDYKRSPKRINYCCVLNDGTFAAIDKIVLFPSHSVVFILCKKYGSISKKIFMPSNQVEEIRFSELTGQTAKLVGKSSESFVFDPTEIKAKCVLAMNNDMTETYLITALANHLETD